MKVCEDMTTTGGRFSRQQAELQIASDRDGFVEMSGAAGGPIDAPSYIAAGGCNSTVFYGVRGLLPRQSDIKRDSCVSGEGAIQ